MLKYHTLNSFSLGEKNILLRADLNVPIFEGKIQDTSRIDRLIPTLKELIEKKAKIVLISHFGRPKGVHDEKYSLRPLVSPLSQKLGQPVSFSDFSHKNEAIKNLQPGGILLLENLRFHPGEEKNDLNFSKELSENIDFYVNDAFSASHRAHASIEAITHILPSLAGRLLEAEIKALTTCLETPVSPVLAIIGGAKISTKISVLTNLLSKVDFLVIGGGMANTFLKATGSSVGASLVEDPMVATAQEILEEAKKAKCQILLQEDGIIATKIESGAPTRVSTFEDIQETEMILDMGPKTLERIKQVLLGCKTVVWNGPVGVFETSPFDTGTTTLAKAVAALTAKGSLQSIAGGGETVAALKQAGVLKDFSYISTAGGAFLEWLEGKELPGISALTKAYKHKEAEMSAQ